MLIIIV